MPTALTPQIEQRFADFLANDRFDEAEAYGKSLGYTDEQIAQYIGDKGDLVDSTGGALTKDAASNYMTGRRTGTIAAPTRPTDESQRNRAGKARFERLLSQGKFEDARDLGLSLGYTAADMADYIGANGLKDDAGNVITTAVAQDWLAKNPSRQTATPTTSYPTTTTTTAPTTTTTAPTTPPVTGGELSLLRRAPGAGPNRYFTGPLEGRTTTGATSPTPPGTPAGGTPPAPPTPQPTQGTPTGTPPPRSNPAPVATDLNIYGPDGRVIGQREADPRQGYMRGGKVQTYAKGGSVAAAAPVLKAGLSSGKSFKGYGKARKC